MSPGRPTLYDPSYCEQVILWGKEGKSKTWMAANLDVTRQTFDNWEKQYPDFFGAMTRAMQLSQAWWEDAGQDNMLLSPGQGTFNASVWSRSMAARFPAEWREKTEQQISGEMAITGITRRVVDSKKPDGTGT